MEIGKLYSFLAKLVYSKRVRSDAGPISPNWVLYCMGETPKSINADSRFEMYLRSGTFHISGIQKVMGNVS